MPTCSVQLHQKQKEESTTQMKLTRETISQADAHKSWRDGSLMLWGFIQRKKRYINLSTTKKIHFSCFIFAMPEFASIEVFCSCAVCNKSAPEVLSMVKNRGAKEFISSIFFRIITFFIKM